MASRGVGLSILVLLALFETGLCLKCYDCTNPGTPGCGSPFSLKTDDLKECLNTDLNLNKGPGKLFCLKVTGKDSKEGVVETQRNCVRGDEDSLNTLCKLAATKVVSDFFCGYCDSDGCNGTSSIVASIPVALLSLVASYLLGRSLM